MKRAKKSSTAQAVGRSGPTDCSALTEIEAAMRLLAGDHIEGNKFRLGLLGAQDLSCAASCVVAAHSLLQTAVDAWKPLPYQDESGVVRLALDSSARIMIALGIHKPNVTGQGTRHLVEGTLDPLVRRVFSV